MQLAGWVRAVVWPAEDWCAALAALAEQTLADPTPSNADRAWDLGNALELVEPNRKRALAMYLVAWRAGKRPDAFDRARLLAREVRAYDIVAELALADYERTTDTAHLVAAGAAWFDADTPERGVEALSRAASQQPDDQEIKVMLAAAKSELRDPRGEISRCAARASRASQDDQARLYLHAARLARAAKIEDLYARFLQMAFHHRPDEETVALIEEQLLGRGKAEAVLEFYRGRLETVTNEQGWIETIRAAATRLMLRGIQPGFALRILRSGLEHAYAAKTIEIPGHVACWELLLRHARKLSSTREIMPLIVEALGLPLGEDDRLYLAAVGFDLAWRGSGDAESARPYAAMMAELVPDHPAVRAFMSKEMAGVLRDNGDQDPKPAIEATIAAVPAGTPPSVPDEPTREVVTRAPASTAAPAPRPPLSMIPSAALTALRSKAKPIGIPKPPPLPANISSRAPRIVIPIDVVIALAGGVTVMAIARDLSTTGAFIATKHDLELEAIVILELHLPGADLLVESRHHVSARVVRRTETGYGMTLVEPSPELIREICAVIERIEAALEPGAD